MVRVLHVGIATPLWGHIVGLHALGTQAPGRTTISRLPDTAARHADRHVPAVARIDHHGMDARRVVAASEPFAALRAIPQCTVEYPCVATILRTKEPTGNCAGPQDAQLIRAAGFERPNLLKRPGRRAGRGRARIVRAVTGMRLVRWLRRVNGDRALFPIGHARAPAMQFHAEVAKIERGIQRSVARIR